jgi:hypothetical protein
MRRQGESRREERGREAERGEKRREERKREERIGEKGRGRERGASCRQYNQVRFKIVFTCISCFSAFCVGGSKMILKLFLAFGFCAFYVSHVGKIF